jgi:hypothetical protein
MLGLPTSGCGMRDAGRRGIPPASSRILHEVYIASRTRTTIQGSFPHLALQGEDSAHRDFEG